MEAKFSKLEQQVLREMSGTYRNKAYHWMPATVQKLVVKGLAEPAYLPKSFKLTEAGLQAADTLCRRDGGMSDE